MAAMPKQPIAEFETSEHWFPIFFIRVLLASVLLTAILVLVGVELMSNH
jgi:hypothetical protein